MEFLSFPGTSLEMNLESVLIFQPKHLDKNSSQNYEDHLPVDIQIYKNPLDRICIIFNTPDFKIVKILKDCLNRKYRIKIL